MTTPTRLDAAPSRLFFLDWVRIAAFGALVLYHVGMYYVSWDWHVKSPHAGTGLEPFMMLSSPWRLSLLFLVSGAATSLMLARGLDNSFLGARSKRLLLPLVCGMLIVVPPQPYFEVVEKAGYAGSYLDFLKLYFTGYRGFCRDGECLILPTWNHLWFVAYLWVYTVAVAAALRWRPAMLDELASAARRLLAGVRLFVVPIAALALVRIALVGRFPSTHALVDDWFNHAVYFGMFAAGAVFVRMPDIWGRLAAHRWVALAVALVCWTLVAAYFSRFEAGNMPPDWLRQGQRVVYATLQWCALVAVLGFARHHLNRDHAGRRYLVDAVFPVYILHQTLIVMLAVAMRPLRWSPVVEGPLLAIATFALSVAGYELVRRMPVVRPWFGLGPSSGGRTKTAQHVHGAAASVRIP